MTALSAPHAIAARPKQVIGLDVVRCLAAVVVMAFHLDYWFWAGADAHAGYGGMTPDFIGGTAIAFGWVGVEIFFVLSGFVIAYSASTANALAFLRSRILRLVPAAWICSTITLLIMLAVGIGPNSSALHVVRKWAYTLAFHPMGPWIDWSYWTLGVEISFYAIVLGLLAAKRFDLLPTVIGLIGLDSSAYWLAHYVPGFSAMIMSSGETADRLRQLTLLDHGCFFAVGAFLWIGFFSAFTAQRVAVLIACTVGGCVEIIARTGEVNAGGHAQFSAVAPCLVWLACLGLLCASILGNAALLSRFGGIAPFVRRLGLMTYPLYLLHQQIGFTLINALHGRAPDLLIVSMVEVIVAALAYIVSVHWEPILRRWLGLLMAGKAYRRT